MKKHIKSLVVMAAAVTALGMGAQKANASGVDFSVGVNLGIPVVASHVYAPVPRYAPVQVAPRYAPAPVRVSYVDNVRCVDGYRHDYRHDRFRHDRGWHKGWDRNHHDRWRR